MSHVASHLRGAASRREPQLPQGPCLQGLVSIELKELWPVVGALVQQRPEARPWERAGQTATKAAPMFGPGQKACGGRPGLTTGVLEGRIPLGAAAHQDLLEALWPALQVVRPAQARIGDGAGGRAGHALAKAFQWWAIEGCLGGVADAVRGGDHPSLPVAGHLRGGTQRRAGRTLAALEGPGIKVIESDQTRVKVACTGQFLGARLIEDRQRRPQRLPALLEVASLASVEAPGKGLQGRLQPGVERSPRGQALLGGQVRGPPALCAGIRIPPQSELASPGKDGPLVKGLSNPPDVVGRKERAVQDA